MNETEDIYELKPEEIVDMTQFLEMEIDFDALKKQYKFKAIDKDLVLRASLELDKKEPDLELVEKASKIIKKYETGMVIIPNYEVEEHEVKIEKKEVKTIHTVYNEPTSYIDAEKKVWLGGVLGFIFGPVGLLYVSWQSALGILVLSIALVLIHPALFIVAPFIALGLGVFGTQQYNLKLTSVVYKPRFSLRKMTDFFSKNILKT